MKMRVLYLWLFAVISASGSSVSPLPMECTDGYAYETVAHIAIARLAVDDTELDEASLEEFKGTYSDIWSLAKLPTEGEFALNCIVTHDKQHKHVPCDKDDFEQRIAAPGVQIGDLNHAFGMGFLEVDTEQEYRNIGVFFALDLKISDVMTPEFEKALAVYQILPVFIVRAASSKEAYETNMINLQICGSVISLEDNDVNNIKEVTQGMMCECQSPKVDVSRRLDNEVFAGNVTKMATTERGLRNRLEKRNLRGVIRNKININFNGCGCCGEVQCSCCKGTDEPSTTNEPSTTPIATIKIVTVPLTCTDKYALEFYYTQDNTGSFRDDIESMRTLLPQLIDKLDSSFFHGFKVGFGSFADKPTKPFGYDGADYCFYQHLPLGREFVEFQEEMDKLQTRSGYDWRENQLEVLQHVALSPASAWSPPDALHPSGKKILKILAISTDAGYHVAGDGALHNYTWPANNGDEHIDCVGEDYPSVEQVKQALQSKGIIPLFLIQERPLSLFHALIAEMDISGIVKSVDDDSSNLINSIVNGIISICETL